MVVLGILGKCLLGWWLVETRLHSTDTLLADIRAKANC